MARDPKKRQKALQRKAAKRKQKQSRQPARPGAHALLRQAGAWPLHEVLISKDWDQEMALVEAVVARRSPLGQTAAGVFLVDLGLLGVKNAYARTFKSPAEYEEKLREPITSHSAMVPADVKLVARIIREATAFARRFGFDPHPDYREAAPLLGDADPDASSVRVPLGKDGKHFYISGPYDDVEAIMRKLAWASGEENFDFVAPLDPGAVLDVDDEVWSEEASDDED